MNVELEHSGVHPDTAWSRPRLVPVAHGATAAEGVLPGITEHGHIHGNSAMHMNGDTTPTLLVGTLVAGSS